MAFVLDCSVALTWILPDEANAAADALSERLTHDVALVPSIWPLEVGNVLVTALRRHPVDLYLAADDEVCCLADVTFEDDQCLRRVPPLDGGFGDAIERVVGEFGEELDRSQGSWDGHADGLRGVGYCLGDFLFECQKCASVKRKT